tara:strand:+ start:504 stop:2891 length:2388 start_codon:yes stop_codon:yes gene_type:complete
VEVLVGNVGEFAGVEEYINVRRKRARRLLKQVNADFVETVIDSPKIQSAEKLWQELRSLNSAVPCELVPKLEEALQCAWYALWKARNYSVMGWKKRLAPKLTNFGPGNLNYLIQEMMQTGVEVDGVVWPRTHQVPFDSTGQVRELKSGSISQEFEQILRTMGLEFSLISEGLVAGSESVFNFLPDHTSLEYAALFSNVPARQSKVSRLSNCLILNVELFHLKAASIKDSAALSSTSVQVRSVPIASDAFENSLFLGGLVLNKVVASPDPSGEVSFLRNSTVFGRLTLKSVDLKSSFVVPKNRAFSEFCILDSELKHPIRVERCSQGIEPLVLRVSSEANSISKLADFILEGVELRSLSIKDAVFSGEVNLNDTYWLESCSILKSTFASNFSCEDMRFGPEANDVCFEVLDCAFIQGETEVAGTSQAIFRNSTFPKRVDFSRSKFEVPVSFEGAEFHQEAAFTCALFEKHANFGSSDRRATIFFKDADFSFPKLDSESSTGAITFLNAEFRSNVDFSNRKFDNLTEFESVKFNSAPSFHGATFHQNVSFRNSRFQWRRSRPLHPIAIGIKFRCLVWIGKVWRFATALWTRGMASYTLPPELERHNRYCKKTTSSFRTLRQAMQSNDDTRQAAIFHREELRARHSRFGDREVTRFEVWVGAIYSLVSDYGESVFRPLAVMIASLCISAIFLAEFSGAGGRFIRPAFGNAIEIQFRPFYHLNPTFGRAEAMGVNDPCSNDINAALHAKDASGLTTYCFSIMAIRNNEFAFKLTVIVQSLITLMCLFLVLLAVRRKLQM